MADSTGRLFESQVDWLTASAHGTESRLRLLDYARALAEREKKAGNKVRRWRLMGYEGTHVGACEYGEREGMSSMVRLIGNLADEQLSTALSVADAVTRVDIACTWRCEPPDPLLGRNEYALAEMHHQLKPLSARPSFVGDADGGYTCYVGHRASDYFLRIYNKGAEAVAKDDKEDIERYRAAWRFELETKGTVAPALAAMVDSREDRAAFVKDYISSWVAAHGMVTPWTDATPTQIIPGFRRRADRDSKLRHLARNVKPTVAWLLEQGELERTLDALGLNLVRETHTEA